MPRSLSAAAVAAMSGEQTSEVPLLLITISHPDLATPQRWTQNVEAITSRGNVFSPIPFDIDLPEESAEGPGEALLRIDNISRQIVATLRSLTSPPTVTIELVLASQPDTVEMTLTDLTLRDASYDANVVQGSLRFDDLTIEPCCETITPARFPGLF